MSRKIKIELPDGSKKEYEKGITGYDIAKSIGSRLADAALAVEVDGKIKDLHSKIEKNSKVKIITYRDDIGKEIFKHSAAHIMADAVTRLFPKAKLTIGPAIEDGFYYDFDVDKPFTEKDLEKIEKEMDKIIKSDHKFIRLEPKNKKEARKKVKKELPGNKYKLEMFDDLGDEQASFYQHGKFIDLCRGPHVPSTGKIKAVKLTKVAGAYWRGDADNEQLNRIYGVAFPSKKELKDYLHLLKEAEKRDHRKLGKEMDLFSFQLEAPGMPFFHNKGRIIFDELVNFMKEEMRKLNYEIIKTPMILNKSLWLQSGHWDHYKENMYFTKIDKQDFAVKPMNCPGGILVFKSDSHSYRDLPIKAGEFGLVHRHELSGVLSGLFRVRVFTQDDAHVYCTEDQIKDQIIELIDLIDKIYSTFGLEYDVELSTRPEKAMGSKKIWNIAEKALEGALKAKKMEYKLNPGDGAFYGPKIDYHVKDVLGRNWQCGTIQLDFSMPQKFNLDYKGKDNKDHRPVMIHRAIYGSVERFLGILVEHFAGKFPLWLAPEQVRLMTVSEKYLGYAEEIRKKFFDAGIRVQIDERTESVSKKVRDAQLDRVPLMLTLGEKEVKKKTVAVRTLDGDVKFGVKPDELLKKMKKNIEKREVKFKI